MADITHGIRAQMTIGSTDFTLYCEDATGDLTREMAEGRPWSVGSVIRVAGARSMSMQASGPLAAAADAVLFAAWDGEEPVAIVFLPLGADGPTYTLDAIIASYQIRNPSTDKVTWQINIQSDGEIERTA